MASMSQLILRLLVLATITLAGCGPIHYRQPSVNWPDENDDAKMGNPREDTPVGEILDKEHEEDYDDYLRFPVVERHYYAPSRRCEQGPIAVQIQWEPSRFMDYVTLVVYVRHDISGRLYRQVGPEAQYGSRGMGMSGAENQACLLKLDEVTPATGGAGAPFGPSTVTPAASERPGDREAEWAAAPPPMLQEIAPPPFRPRGKRILAYENQWLTVDLDTGRRLESPIRKAMFVIWFEEPNDLEDATFVLARRVGQPVASDADILAQLRKIRDKAKAERAELDDYWAKQHKKDAERDRFCDAHHENTDCWGPGGYEGARAATLKAQAAPPPASPHGLSSPMGPPPAPLADPGSPSPSANATWVPGYWSWTDNNWTWFRGRWRVPPADVQADLTVHAPIAPPPPPPEARPAPPSPSPRLIWTPGFWQWDGARFLWVAGGWVLAPAQGAVWIPDRWDVRGGRFIFLPGGWAGPRR
jgi:hypothetical protein